MLLISLLVLVASQEAPATDLWEIGTRAGKEANPEWRLLSAGYGK
jgi:hypothetical protein